MGCGRSKEKVACIATRKKHGGATDEKTPSEADSAKDIVAVADVEGNLIGRDSSDRYFSTRKDEVALEAETGSGGYQTPLAEDHGTLTAWGTSKDMGIEEEEKDRAVEVAAEVVVEAEEEEKGEGGKISASNFEQVRVAENGGESKININWKEDEEEKKAEKIVAEKGHVSEGEIVINLP